MKLYMVVKRGAVTGLAKQQKTGGAGAEKRRGSLETSRRMREAFFAQLERAQAEVETRAAQRAEARKAAEARKHAATRKVPLTFAVKKDRKVKRMAAEFLAEAGLEAHAARLNTLGYTTVEDLVEDLASMNDYELMTVAVRGHWWSDRRRSVAEAAAAAALPPKRRARKG